MIKTFSKTSKESDGADITQRFTPLITKLEELKDKTSEPIRIDVDFSDMDVSAGKLAAVAESLTKIREAMDNIDPKV